MRSSNRGNEWDRTKLNSSRSIDRTTAVGLYPQGNNPAHGASDLSGNVSEWCLTVWQDEYTSPEAEDNDPNGSARRVVRGGSWVYHVIFCRAAARGRSVPVNWYYTGGVRVCLSVPI